MGRGNKERRKVTQHLRKKRKISMNLKQYRGAPSTSSKPSSSAISKIEVMEIDTGNTEVVASTSCGTSISHQEVLDSPNKTSIANVLEGRRIVDFPYLFEEIRRMNDHSQAFGCTFNNLEFLAEHRCGLSSTLVFKCNMCRMKLSMNLNKPDETTMDVNTAAVSAAMSIGIGFSNSEEMFSTMDIPYLSFKTYGKFHTAVSEGWHNTATEKMNAAAKREAEYAIEIGNVDKNGTPLITVVADGCWSKRSYKKNYSALSGVAAIEGKQFGEVLFIGVRNKYCTLCARSSNKNEDPLVHKCFKNFEGSSTSMEADILVEGFKTSEKMYGIKYSKIIADGDSRTYKKILEARPYSNLTVEKIECRNHLLRNFCNKLILLTTDTRYPLHLRRLLKNNIHRLRNGIVGAIAHNKTKADGVRLLKNNIDNVINHVFGLHDNCEAYFCTKTESEKNLIPDLKCCALLYSRIEACVQVLSINTRSLIADVDSNIVEQFNSKVAKFVGGKRINYSLKNSYASRCSAAVVSFNTGRPHYELHKNMYTKSPSGRIKKLELSRQKKIRRALMQRISVKHINQKIRKRLFKSKSSDQSNIHYGEFCQKPDKSPEEFEEQKTKFLLQIEKTKEEREKLERDTILQSASGQWLEYRRKILTASNFYNICSRRRSTSCVNLIKKLLYGSELHAPAIAHGRANEHIALKQLEQQENLKILQCGLFIHKDYSFIGATPDGITENNLIVEVKCPFSAYNMEANSAIQEKKIKFWTYDPSNDIYTVNQKHTWFYQIQGQLAVTGRNGCIFAVWTGETYPLKVAYIRRDKRFWENNMLGKLYAFYYECMLPELVDPRFTRSMPIRDPPSVIAAQEEINKKRNNQTNN